MPWVDRQCLSCAAPVKVLASHVARGEGKYCSRRCANSHGKPRWKPFDPVAAFWSLVDKSGGDGACWPWMGGSKNRGYGRVIRDGRTVFAHRYALQLSSGPAPLDKPFALHGCDNPSCCNPAHLRWGTPQDNMDDRRSRNRFVSTRRKVDPAVAARLRQEGHSYSQIAVSFGVNQATVAKALKRSALLLTLQAKGEDQ